MNIYACPFLKKAWKSRSGLPSSISLDRTPFKIEDFKDPKKLPIDSHQIGLPLNSFLLRLQKQFPTKKVYSTFVRVLSSFPIEKNTSVWSCSFQNKTLPQDMRFSLPSAAKFFAQLKGLLIAQGLPANAVQKTWEEANLDMTISIARHFDGVRIMRENGEAMAAKALPIEEECGAALRSSG